MQLGEVRDRGWVVFPEKMRTGLEIFSKNQEVFLEQLWD